jgi:hypothetical protein
VRTRYERLFGTRLDQVSVHTDSAATDAAELLGAAAGAIGSRIFFAPGRFDPSTPTGGALLAHELTHVVQQQAQPVRLALKAITSGAEPVGPTDDEPAAEAMESHYLAQQRAGLYEAQPLPLARAVQTTAAGVAGSYTHFDLHGPALGTASAPAIARFTSATYGSAGHVAGDGSADSDTIERVPDGATGSAAPGQPGAAAELDPRKLAQAVYELIKDDLAAERERRGRWL